MMEDPQQLEKLLKLPVEERLRLARWLIESTEKTPDDDVSQTNSLLALAGRYSGGPGDTAERVEEILQSEVDSTEGLSAR